MACDNNELCYKNSVKHRGMAAQWCIWTSLPAHNRHYQWGVGRMKMKEKILHHSQHSTSLQIRRGLNILSLQLPRENPYCHVEKSKHKNKWPLQLCLKINVSYWGGGAEVCCDVLWMYHRKIFWIIHVSDYSQIFSPSLVQTILILLQYQIETYYIRLKHKTVLLYTRCTKNTPGFLKFENQRACHTALPY